MQENIFHGLELNVIVGLGIIISYLLLRMLEIFPGNVETMSSSNFEGLFQEGAMHV